MAWFEDWSSTNGDWSCLRPH